MLASIGSAAVSSGSKNPPRWLMSLFFADDDTCLSAILRSIALYFFDLRLLQSDSIKFPFKMFQLISFIKLTTSLLQFEMMALSIFGLAVLNT